MQDAKKLLALLEFEVASMERDAIKLGKKIASIAKLRDQIAALSQLDTCAPENLQKFELVTAKYSRLAAAFKALED